MEEIDFFDEVTLIWKGESKRMALFDAVLAVVNSPNTLQASEALIVQEGKPTLRFADILDMSKSPDFPPLAAD